MSAPRVALVGLALESNRWSKPAGEADFTWLAGDRILTEARATAPALAMEAAGFVRAMDATGPWAPVPVLLAGSYPAGPIEQATFETALARMLDGLAAARPLDAVYICNHGGMTATHTFDPDGEMVARIRAAVGPAVRIVMTLDLHANISQAMVDGCNLIVGYRTNPHVDMLERGEEAAFALRRMLSGHADPKPVLVRLPLTPASVNLLTGSGPYGDMIDYGQKRQAELAGGILNVSVFGGFVFSDTPKNGVAVVVTARSDRALAKRLADEIAGYGWDMRARFRKTLTPVAEAVALATARDRAPVIFSESGDNPGGGGSGRTTELLQALCNAGAEDALVGSFFDPELAAEAHALGLGARFHARFNRARGNAPWEQWDTPFAADAEVVGLTDGRFVGRLGLFQGRSIDVGPSAALRIGGITVVVISARNQTADPMFFEMFGLDIGKARTVAVKSRGHFRAGFLPWFPPAQVKEVDTAGLTSPVLERLPFAGLPRPCYPLDEDASWTPAA
ncbi:MAG: M81 family metallopeptidase [Hyphomicrobiaceae bacterium]|nr:M81 family metallopeptidase [Hyphomicrobiaceae bacterium]